MMNRYVLSFAEINKTSLPLVGGKGANLGELFHIPRIKVPGGFCINTQAYDAFINSSTEFSSLLDQLELIDDNLENIKVIGQRIRIHLEGLDIPSPIKCAIVEAWKSTGCQHAYAVRSSATAEDLPGASFAGQQDTYLNIIGEHNILNHVRKCWASLFTDRAIAYRIKNSFDHREVLLSVVIQQMIFSEISGIMFTSDPVTGNRKIVSIDASFGLGEALVSGIVNTDSYKVRNGKITKKQVATKTMSIIPLPEGGTDHCKIPTEHQKEQALPDEAILQLEKIGRQIESHFGQPQDIEWSYTNQEFYIVQSRPITTLYPLPDLLDNSSHVFVSFGHNQMMTDPLKPLGISFWSQLEVAVNPNDPSPVVAGGRLYIDITNSLSTWIGRKTISKRYIKDDTLIRNAIDEVLREKDFIATLRRVKQSKDDQSLITKAFIRPLRGLLFNRTIKVPNVEKIADDCIITLRSDLSHQPASEWLKNISNIYRKNLDLILSEIAMPLAASQASLRLIGWLSKRWATDKINVDELVKSAPHNVSTEMGLALGDLADIIRPYPSSLEYLKQTDDTTFFDGLERIAGGDVIRAAFTAFLHKYGMRCPGEIDISRPRWREKPTQLVASIISHIKSTQHGEHRYKFENGEASAERAKEELIKQIKKHRLFGKRRARIMTSLIKTCRSYLGIREYPKFFLVRILDEYKKAILKEAEQLVQNRFLDQENDVFYLTIEELITVVTTGLVDQQKIVDLKENYIAYEKMPPPRILTSEGTAIIGSYGASDLPKGALEGIPVSAGVIEGRARIIKKLEEANLEKGDILVTTFTDPGWTPLFTSISGLVTEIGGQMTHGAVVAREYGLPAVVGVTNATHIIHDGQKIRVNGTEGFVEVLE